MPNGGELRAFALDSALAPFEPRERREIRSVLEHACGSPDLADQAAWVRSTFLEDEPSAVSLKPRYQRLEDTITQVWRANEVSHRLTLLARRYVRQLRPVVRTAAQHERCSLDEPPRPPEPVDPPTVYGDWLVTLKLGAGGDGDAFLAQHAISGFVATLKTPAGTEGYVWQHLMADADERSEPTALDWHPRLVRIFDGGRPPFAPNWPRLTWIVRDYADTSLYDARRAHAGLPLDEVLDVFGMACDVVAWLHRRGVFRWSAHTRNVLRVDGQWQVADLGRGLILVDEDHWATAYMREVMGFGWSLPPLAEVPPSWWSFVDRLRWASSWSGRTNGFWPHHPEIEDRLRRDDCATLGGLLCQLLSGTRFDHFLKALEPPLCTATYTLTGDVAVDQRLSQILNRAWLGDAGGAIGAAASGDEITHGGGFGYLSPRGMLADVQAAFD